ncbi:ATP-binding protein [Candidatus Woesearchaeota archaeon]|nr:ATP-binding protein [Candidatus Woesearchaeota archaeon]
MTQQSIGKIVYYESTPSFGQVTSYLNPGEDVRPGELLKIQNEEDKWLIGRVLEATEINPYEEPEHTNLRHLMGLQSQSMSEGLPRKFRVAFLDILEEAEVDGQNVNLHEPHSLAKVGSPIFRVDTEMFTDVLNLMPPDQEKDGLSIGYAAGNQAAKVILDPEKILPRHTLIVGGTGTGKSYCRGVLMEEIRKLNLPQINIDIHAEYNKATEELGGIVLVPGQSLTVPLSSLTEPEILGLIPKLTELQEDIFKAAYTDLRRRGIQFDLQELLTAIDEAGERSGGAGRTMHLITRRVETLRSVRIIGDGINWKDTLSKYLIVNIDCRKLGYVELQAIAGAIARDIIRLRDVDSPQIPPLILSIDEAHMFIPNTADASSSYVIRETIRMGRHKGIGLILMTQNPNDIDRSSIKLTNTRLIFSIEQDQLESLKGVFADAPKDIINKLPKFEVGTCLLTGSRDSIRHSTIVKIRKRKTTHGGVTPKMLETKR